MAKFTLKLTEIDQFWTKIGQFLAKIDSKIVNFSPLAPLALACD